MRRRLIAISVSLVALASLVFAGSNGLPSLSAPQTVEREEKPSISANASPKKRDYVEMKSDEGWQMLHNGQKIMVVVGNFAAHHNGTVITADSAVRYSERHIECFGNVLINRGSTYIYGDRAEYDGNANEAKVYSKIVKVVDGSATLYTYNFLYNTKTSIGRYSGGGVLVSGENMLESDRGYVYSDNHEIICVDRVQMRNAEYEMTGDSVVYNTETDYAQFFTNTHIWNKSANGNSEEDDYLYADRGSFDKSRQLYKLTRNGYILTKEQEMLCDSLDYYRDSNYVLLKRNIQIDDTTQKLLLFGDWGEYWKEPGNVFVTRDPSLISYDTSQGDTLFVRSDSMYVYTHYPIREKIEQARKDSLAQVAKKLAADSVKQAVSEKVEESKSEKATKAKEKALEAQEKAKKMAEAKRGKKGNGSEELSLNSEKGASTARKNPTSKTQITAKAQESPKVEAVAQKESTDSIKVASDSVKVLSKAEIRRKMIDSLASDTTKQGVRLRAKLLKEESNETNKAVKKALKETQRKKAAERAVVLAERKSLFAKLLGEARVRDAERRRIEKERAKFVKDSIKQAKRLAKKMATDSVAVDSLKLDSLKLDSLKLDTLKVDSLKRDTLKIDSLKRDSLLVDSIKTDSVKIDSLAKDSIKVDSLAKFDTMTVKQVKAYFKAIYDAEKAEENRIKQDSLNAELERIGLARQAKRAEQYRKWAIRDSIYNVKAQERADEQLRRKLARMEKRGIFIQMADSATLAQVDSILLADFGPLDSVMHHRLDSLITVLYPQEEFPSPSEIAKEEALNLDSLYREIQAYSRVKMFRSDFQSVCDSLTMTTVDSIMHMYKAPVMWNGASQITSEIMHIISRNSQLVQADFEGKPMMVSEIDTVHYNQVAGKDMRSLFRDNQIYRNDVNGNVQTIYYMQEDNSPEITLMAYIEAGDMTSYIEGQQVVGITYRGNPTYTFYPMDKIPETQPTKLDGFKWEAMRRPSQDSVFARTIRPSQRIEKRALSKPRFPINALLEQRKSNYLRRKEWVDRTDTLTYETIEWLESLRTY